MKFNCSYSKTRIKQKRKQYVVVIYDISKTKRRNKFVKIMNSYGGRVQLSAFEFLLTPREYSILIDKIDVFYDEAENDQIRIYKFREETDVIVYGDQKLVSENDFGLEFV